MKLRSENCPIEVKTNTNTGKQAINPALSSRLRVILKVLPLLIYFMIRSTVNVNAAKNIANGKISITIGIC